MGRRIISIIFVGVGALYSALAFFGGPFAVGEFFCNRASLLCWLSPSPPGVAEPTLQQNAAQLDGRLRLETNWQGFVGLTLRSRDYLFGLRRKTFVVATFRNADDEIVIDTIADVDGEPQMLYGPDRRHLLIAFRRTDGGVELRLYVTDKRFLARRFEIDCRGGRRERLEISNLGFDPTAPSLKFDLQSNCGYGSPELAGKVLSDASSNETVGVRMTPDFYVASVSALSVESEETAQKERLEVARAKFLNCPSSQATGVRATYPDMGAAVLYCWAWQSAGFSDTDGYFPGTLIYRALLISRVGESTLLQGSCPATIDADLFVGGNEIEAGVAVAPNDSYAIVGCRTYSTVYRPKSDTNHITDWSLLLAGQGRRSTISLRCRCKELQIDRALYDHKANQLILNLSVKGTEVWFNGQGIQVPSPDKEWLATRFRVAVIFGDGPATTDVKRLAN